MIDSVPLIQNANDVQQINASIIAMKKVSRELDEKIAQFNKLLSQEITNREKAITEAINSLDVPSVGGSGKYISAISETDGKISATESDITSTVSSGNSQPVTSGGVAEAIQGVVDVSSSLPTDAVLHYSFDDIPDLPDGTADARFTDGNTYSLQSTSYKLTNNNGTTFSNVNGNVVANITAGTGSNGFRIPIGVGKIVKITVKVSSLSTGGTLRVRNGVSTGSSLVDTISSNGTYTYTILTVDAVTDGLFILEDNPNTSATVEVTAIYIGDGSYSTPIIDNANGQNNAVNNGGIAVQGVSGKGAYFINRKNAEVNDFNFTDDFSISVWVKPDNMESGKMRDIVAKSSCFYFRNGDGGSNNHLFGAVFNKLTSNYEYFHIQLTLLDNTKYTHICITKNGATVKAFVDGVLSRTTDLNFIEMNKNNNSLCVNGTINTSPQSIDDLLIFDRALTDAEVMALYLNKANTPKYYSWADWKLSNT